jgi:hypothetical protein
VSALISSCGGSAKFASMRFDKSADPFASVIRCTCGGAADNKMISKWARALRYAAIRKPPEMRLKAFMKQAGGVNENWTTIWLRELSDETLLVAIAELRRRKAAALGIIDRANAAEHRARARANLAELQEAALLADELSVSANAHRPTLPSSALDKLSLTFSAVEQAKRSAHCMATAFVRREIILGAHQRTPVVDA